MRPESPAVPAHPPRSEFERADNALLILWRTIWLDLPLAWACQVDRLLYRWGQPAAIGDCLFGFDAGRTDSAASLASVPWNQGAPMSETHGSAFEAEAAGCRSAIPPT